MTDLNNNFFLIFSGALNTQVTYEKMFRALQGENPIFIPKKKLDCLSKVQVSHLAKCYRANRTCLRKAVVTSSSLRQFNFLLLSNLPCKKYLRSFLICKLLQTSIHFDSNEQKTNFKRLACLSDGSFAANFKFMQANN